jgi:hypothetical protein
MIQQFTFDGTGRQIDARGVTFRYESGTDAGGVTDLKLWIDGNAVGTLSPGDLLELPEAGKRWEVKPVSSSCVGVVKIGMGKITTTKVAGVVSTVDGGRARSIEGAAFIFSANVTSNVGGVSTAQIFNPAGSGKRVIVKSSRISLASGGAWGVTWKNAPAGAQNFGCSVVPKSFDKQTSAAQAYGQNTSAAVPANDWPYSLCTATVTASSVDAVVFQEPIVLEPGKGLMWFVAGQNNGLILVSEFTEEKI